MIFIGILALYKPIAEKQYLTEQDRRLKSVHNALIDYIIDDPSDNDDPSDLRMPCPAPMDASPTDPNFGIEQCITGAANDCANGVCLRLGTGGQLVMVGAIPTRTLGLSSDSAIDAVKSRLTYAVTQKLTIPGSMPNLNTSGAIQIIENLTPTTLTAPFVLLSHGKNKLAATSYQGLSTLPCSTSIIGDGENCNNDAVFRFQMGESNKGTLDDYDDKIVFRFENDLAIGGICPPRQFMTGFSNSGAVCADLFEAGMIVDLNATVNEIADTCIDPTVPTREQNIPIALGGSAMPRDGWATVRWFSVCGPRLCKARGFDDGSIREQTPTRAIVRCTSFRSPPE